MPFIFNRPTLIALLMVIPSLVTAQLPVPAVTTRSTAPPTLETLRGARSITRQSGKTQVNEIRATALKETALMYGTRAGLYHRTREIQQRLDARADRYDEIFQFTHLMMANNICPPVVQVGYDSQRLHGNAAQTMRLADASYQIVRDPEFAPHTPNWRTYLYLTAQPPAPPDESLLPDRGKPAEVALWEDYIGRGWDAGVRQAERTFEVKLAELTRDLKGMALYRELLAKDMVTPPQVDEKFLGLTGNRRRLDVNDRLLTIRAAPTFVRKNQRWKPYPHRASERAKQRFLADPIPITVHRPVPIAPAAVSRPAAKTVAPAAIRRAGGWSSQ